MIDHISLSVGDLTLSREFFTRALAPLGIGVAHEFSGAVAFARGERPTLWLGQGKHRSTAVHLAFSADQRSQVDEFYRCALVAGGRDNGAPGLRPAYHPNYYAAFVIAPDGHNIEAVCHRAVG